MPDLLEKELRELLSDPEFAKDEVRAFSEDGAPGPKLPAFVKRSYGTQRMGRREVKTLRIIIFLMGKDAEGLNEDDSLMVNDKLVQISAVEPGLEGLTRLYMRETALSYADDDE